MHPALRKLTKILDLETHQGYADRAVIGGLGVFVARWRAETVGGVPDDVRTVVGRLDGYGDLPVEERAVRVTEVLRRARAAESDAGYGEAAGQTPGSGSAEGRAKAAQRVGRATAPSSAAASRVTSATAHAVESSTAAGSRGAPATDHAVEAPTAARGDSGLAAVRTVEAPGSSAAASGEEQPAVDLRTGSSGAANARRSATAGGERPAPSPGSARDGVEGLPAAGSVADDPELARPVIHARGIGATSAEHLARLGIVTVRDLLFHAPSRYLDYQDLRTIDRLRPGDVATVVGTVWEMRESRARNNLHVLTVTLSDTTATVDCTFFNQPYLVREFRPGRRVVVSGRLESGPAGPHFAHLNGSLWSAKAFTRGAWCRSIH